MLSCASVVGGVFVSDRGEKLDVFVIGTQPVIVVPLALCPLTATDAYSVTLLSASTMSKTRLYIKATVLLCGRVCAPVHGNRYIETECVGGTRRTKNINAAMQRGVCVIIPVYFVLCMSPTCPVSTCARGSDGGVTVCILYVLRGVCRHK